MTLKMHRVAKFKQRREIKSRRYLATLAHIQQGGCTGLSVCWIEQHLTFPSMPATMRIARFNNDYAWNRINQLADRFNNRALGRLERVHGVAPNISNRSHGVAVYIDGDSDFKDLRETLIGTCGYYMVELVFKKGTINHMCALYAGGQRMKFFDPNSGEYVVNNVDIARFFRKLRGHYAGYIAADGTAKPQEFDVIWLYPLGG
jgi:hypothetical protein